MHSTDPSIPTNPEMAAAVLAARNEVLAGLDHFINASRELGEILTSLGLATAEGPADSEFRQQMAARVDVAAETMPGIREPFETGYELPAGYPYTSPDPEVSR